MSNRFNPIRLIITAVVFLTALMTARAEGFFYEILNVPSEYSNNVKNLVVVPGGYVWEGTEDGLLRMDHRTFSLFTADGSRNSLPGNDITKLSIDSKGRLWILTDQGLALYHRETDDFEPIMMEIKGEMRNIVASSVVALSDGVLIGGLNTLYYYDADGNLSVKKELNSMPPFNVNEIYKISRDSYLLFDSKQGFLEYNYDKNELAHYKYPLNVLGSHCYYMDSERRFWRSVFNKGLECYKLDGTLLAHYTTENSSLSDNVITCITEKDGKIWAGTMMGGINIIDPVDGPQFVLNRIVGSANDFPNSSIKSLFRDHKNDIWAVRDGGGVVVVRNGWCRSFFVSPSADVTGPVSLMVTDLSTNGTDDSLWIGTKSDGIFYLPRHTGPLYSQLKRGRSTSGHSIISMTSLPGGRILVACLGEGLFVFDKNADTFTPLNLVDKTIENYLRSGDNPISLSNDSQGNIIIITDNFYVFDPASKNLTLIKSGLDRRGELHIGVGGPNDDYYHSRRYIYKWDPDNWEIKMVFDMGENLINCATTDYSGNIWVASEKGLLKVDKSMESYAAIDNQILTSAQTINCDRLGRLWVGTRECLYVYLPEDGSVIKLDISDGVVPNNYAPQAAISTSDGQLAFGGVNGIVVIDSSIEFQKEETPNIELMSLYLNEEHINDYSKLVFAPSFNKIVVKIFAGDEDVLKTKRYRFRVDGPQHSVTIIEGDDIPYINIRDHRAGNYKVYATCTMRTGEWCDWQEVVSYKIKPYWYQNPWILIPVLVLLLAAVAVLIMRKKTK